MKLHLDNILNVAGNTSITGSNTFSVGNGATTLGGTLGVTGNTTLSGNTTMVKHASNVSGCCLIIEEIFCDNIDEKVFFSLLLPASKV